MGSVKAELIRNLAVLVMVSGLVGGCARDHASQPFHSDIRYDRSQSHTYLSEVPPANAPSTRDWKTNQAVGVGYGTTGDATTPNAAQGTAIGAASTPSGTSSGAGAGVTSGGAGVITAPAVGPTPGSGTPGTIIGNPPSTGPVGTSSATPPGSTINNGAGINAPSPGTGPNSTPFRTGTLTTPGSLTTPGPNRIGVTNTGPGVLFTNTVTGQTNLLPGTGLNRPIP
jgi:hypothetical protein